MSMKGLRPATKSAINRPVVGALVMPLPWPNASKMRPSWGVDQLSGASPAYRAVDPSTGSPANCKVMTDLLNYDG